jgi:hypothetical protein
VIFAIGTALVVASALLAWAFCVGYHLSARWWESEAGRHLMSFTASLGVVLSLWAVGAMTPTKGLWWEVLRLVAFTGVPVSLAWRVSLLWRRQIHPGLRRRQRKQKT